MERPTGITLLALVSAVSGLLGICGALPVFGISLIGGLVAPPVGAIGGVIGIFLIVGPILQLVFAYGAWNLRSWAWLLGLIATGLSVVTTLISILSGVGIATAVFNGLLPIIIFVYLLMPNVRSAFRVA